MGLLGVVTSLAPKISDRLESDILHQIALYKNNSYKGTCRDKEYRGLEALIVMQEAFNLQKTGQYRPGPPQVLW